LNTELAEEIIGLILMEPDRMDMTEYIHELDAHPRPLSQLRECGTTACIAGHAVMLTAGPGVTAMVVQDGDVAITQPGGEWQWIDAAASEALRLTGSQAMTLFHRVGDDEAVVALKFLIGNPDATGADLKNFLDEGRA
jgi:hypothetical protein